MRQNLKLNSGKLNSSLKCTDCGMAMEKHSQEYMCPKCGFVQDVFEGM